MSDTLTAAILKETWQLWQDRCPDGQHNGDRIFTRWVDFDPNNPGWDDWTLSALVVQHGGGLEIINDPENPLWGEIRTALAAGINRGESCGNGCNVQWIRHNGDGPAERMSDFYAIEAARH